MQKQKLKIVIVVTAVIFLAITGWKVWLAMRPPSLIRWKQLMATGERYSHNNRFQNAEWCYAEAINEAKRLAANHRLAESYLALANLRYYERWFAKSQNLATASPFQQVENAFSHGPRALLRTIEEIGDFQQANKVSQDVAAIVTYYQQALQILELTDGHNAPSLLPALRKMAELAELQNITGAQPYRWRIWQIVDTAYGPDDRRTREALNALVDIDCKLRCFSEAAHLRQQVLARCETRYRNSSYEILPALTALARIYRLAKDYHRAEPLYLRGIAITERIYHRPYTSMTDPTLYGTSHWKSVRYLLDDYCWQLAATGRQAAAQAMRKRLTD